MEWKGWVEPVSLHSSDAHAHDVEMSSDCVAEVAVARVTSSPHPIHVHPSCLLQPVVVLFGACYVERFQVEL